MSISVAIIGSGPAGFYAAEALAKSCEGCQVDIIERLPTPFGLIRGGVAPDHQTTKGIARKFEKTALRDEVNYFGNVLVGGDISVAELRDLYDVVVLTTGAPNDRKLTIPGADKRGVYGAAAVVGWYNGHPDFQALDPDINVASVAIIGNGNVAIDLARVLVHSPERLAESDVSDYARQAINDSALRDVHVIGRRGPVEASFTNIELNEMGELDQSMPVVRAEQLPADMEAAIAHLSGRDRRLAQQNLKTLRQFADSNPTSKSKRVNFEFYAAPVEILGGDRVEGLRLERTRVVDGRAEATGELFEIECGVVIAAIGYRSEPIAGLPFDADRGAARHQDGRIDEGFYAGGWIKRGPSGTISSNRSDGDIIAAHVVEDFKQPYDSSKLGRQGLQALLTSRGVRSVSYADWKRIEAREVGNATAPSPRRKLVTVEDMLAVLD